MMNDGRNTGQNLAILIGGIAAGILGSRLLPPLVAAGMASARTKRGEDAFDMLIADHREISMLLNDMSQQTPDSTTARLTSFLMLKRKLAKHAMAEEDVVYPILHAQAEDRDRSKHLYDEHADIKIHLFEMEELLKKRADWKPQVESLRQLIEGHVREEEQVVFPQLRQMLEAQQRLPKVSGQISREEALVL